MKAEKIQQEKAVHTIQPKPRKGNTVEFADRRPVSGIQMALEKMGSQQKPVQRFVFAGGRVINLEEACKRLGVTSEMKEEYRKLELYINSEKQYLIEDMPRLIGLDKRIWKTVGSTRADKGEVTGKIGSVHWGSGPAADAMLASSTGPEEVEEIEEVGKGHVDGLGSVAENMELEENIGSMLLNAAQVKEWARQIHEVMAQGSATTDQEIRQQAHKHAKTWGGAQGFMHRKSGVDEEVYAATQHFTATVTAREGGPEGFAAWNRDYPEGNVLHKRIDPPPPGSDKPFTFDEPIEKTDHEWPPHTKSIIKDVIEVARSKGEVDEPAEVVVARLKKMPPAERNKETERLHIRSSISRNLAGETASPLEIVNPRGAEFRQSNSGRQHNVIIDTDYIDTATALQKPVLSGPSGTAFRFLKAYSERMIPGRGPSMEQARLVIMANLLPPNGHHSYHEIMEGSVQVRGLQYQDRSGYGDMARIMPRTVERAKEMVGDGTSHTVRQQNPPKGKRHFPEKRH